MTKKKKIILIGGGVLLVGALVTANLMRDSGKSVTVQVEEVTNEKIVEITNGKRKLRKKICIAVFKSRLCKVFTFSEKIMLQ